MVTVTFGPSETTTLGISVPEELLDAETVLVLRNTPANIPLPLKLPVGELLLSLALKYPEGLARDKIVADSFLEDDEKKVGGVTIEVELELVLEFVIGTGDVEEVPNTPDILPSPIAASVMPE